MDSSLSGGDKKRKREPPEEGEKRADPYVMGNKKMCFTEELMHYSDQLPKFDPSEIELDSTIVLFGKRNTGKSFYTRYLFSILRRYFPYGYVVTRTKHNGFWQQHLPESKIFNKYYPSLVDYLFEQQKERIRDPTINPYIFLVLDDIVSDKSLRYDPALTKLFYEGRHYGIFLVITSQYAFGLPPGIRANTDYVVIFTQQQQRQKKALSEDYADDFEFRDEFYAMLSKYTRDNMALIIAQRDPNKRAAERYYWDKAHETTPFTLGCNDFWRGTNVEQQRVKWKPIPKRSRDMLKRKFNTSTIRNDQIDANKNPGLDFSNPAFR